MQSVFSNPLGAFQRLKKEKEDIMKRQKVVGFVDLLKRLPPDNAQRVNESLNVCVIAADLFETHLRIVKSTLSDAVKNEQEVLIFEDFKSAMDILSPALNAHHNKMSEEFQYEFSEEAERVDDYVTNRIRIFLRKLKRVTNKRKSNQ